MKDAEIVEPARHLLGIDYAVRGELDEEAHEMERSGTTVRRLAIGDPAKAEDYQMLFQLVTVLMDALKDPKSLQYGESKGIYEIRQLIADGTDLPGILGKSLTPDDISIGYGSTELIAMAHQGVLNPGESIMLSDPCYPLYPALTTLFHGEVIFYGLDAKNNWQLNVSELEAKVKDDTKGIVVINPNNPTGRNHAKEKLQEVRHFADEHHLLTLADEVYSFLNYDGKEHVPLASLEGKWPVLTFGSLSKNYRAPGLRMGWVSLTDPENRAELYWKQLKKLADLRLCPSVPLQHAIRPAFEDEAVLAQTVNGEIQS